MQLKMFLTVYNIFYNSKLIFIMIKTKLFTDINVLD